MLSTCSLFLRISIINIFLERNIYCGYYMKIKITHVIDILRENRKLNQHGFFSNIKYLVWMVFSQGMLESNQGLYRLKKVALVHFFLNQNWIAAWFPPIIITSWLRWEYTPAKHPLPHTVYIYVWQLCGLPSSIFHFRKKKKYTFNQCFIKYVYVCFCCAI